MAGSYAFPEASFPCHTPLKETINLTDRYGCFQAANVIPLSEEKTHVHSQYHHGDQTQGLQAKEPTLPLVEARECDRTPIVELQDLVKFVAEGSSKRKLVDRADGQALNFQKRYPELTWGSALDFLQDSYVDRWRYDHKFKKRHKKDPVVCLRDVHTDKSYPRLFSHLEPCIYDIKPNTLLTLLKEEINDTIHKQYIDQDFYGGCLAYHAIPTSSQHEGLLLYPSGPTLEVLNINTLPYQDVPIYTIKNSPSLRFATSSPIRQIEAVSLPSEDGIIAGVRSDYRCCLLKVATKSEELKARVMLSVQTQQQTASIAPSPFVPGECLVGLHTGGVQRIDPEKGCVCIVTTPELAEQSPSWCHYGSHPRLVVSHQRRSMDLLDCRASTEGAVCILSLPSKDIPGNQEIFVSKQHPVNHFYHFVATQELLLLLDERFPKYTVLEWCHALSTAPNYMDITPQVTVKDGSDTTSDLIVLASQASREVHCFQCSELTGGTPEGTSTPWKIASTDGWLDWLPEYPSTDLDPVRSRLQRPLIGVAAAKRTPREGCEPGATVFQLSSAGDLFFQTYSQTNADRSCHDRTLAPGPGCPRVQLSEESQVHCRDWLQSVICQAMQEPRPAGKAHGFWQVPAEKVAQAFQLTTVHRSPDDACRICTTADSHQRDIVPPTTHSKTCPACGVNISDSMQLKDWFDDDRTVLPKRKRSSDVKLPSDHVNPREYDDEMSKTLYRIWVHGYGKDENSQDFEENGETQDYTDQTTAASPNSQGSNQALVQIMDNMPKPHPEISVTQKQKSKKKARRTQMGF